MGPSHTPKTPKVQNCIKGMKLGLACMYECLTCGDHHHNKASAYTGTRLTNDQPNEVSLAPLQLSVLEYLRLNPAGFRLILEKIATPCVSCSYCAQYSGAWTAHRVEVDSAPGTLTSPQELSSASPQSKFPESGK
jgi:hypothetical protein